MFSYMVYTSDLLLVYSKVLVRSTEAGGLARKQADYSVHAIPKNNNLLIRLKFGVIILKFLVSDVT